MHPARHRLRVDFAEQHAALLDLARACTDFDVHVERLTVDDYSIDDRVVVERKTHADYLQFKYFQCSGVRKASGPTGRQADAPLRPVRGIIGKTRTHVRDMRFRIPR